MVNHPNRNIHGRVGDKPQPAGAKVTKDILSDYSVAWNVEYVDGLLNITIGCVDQNAAELLAESLNDAAWVQADVGETVGH